MCNATMQEAPRPSPSRASGRSGPASAARDRCRRPVVPPAFRLVSMGAGHLEAGGSPGGGTLMIRKPRTAMRRTGLQDQGKGDRVAEARFGIRPAMIL